MAQATIENIPPDIYDQCFSKSSRKFQQGYGLTPFLGKKHQRGHGIGNIFGSIFRTLLPIVKPALKTAGKELLKGGVDVVSNIISGSDAKTALKKATKRGLSNLTSKAGQFINEEMNSPKKPKIIRKRKSANSRPSKIIKKRKIKNKVEDIFG